MAGVLTHLSRRPAYAGLTAALAILIVLPAVTAPHLLMLDAPAHEARLAVLRDLLITGHGSPFYHLDTFFLPNIAFDLIGLGLVPFVSPEAAGRIFFVLVLLLTVSGIAVLNRVATGRWNIAPLASALLLYNLVSILGFYSYAFGLALVPWALAGRLKLEARAPAIGMIAGAGLSVLLLFCHLFAFGIYTVMSAGFALTALCQKRIGIGQALMRVLEPVPAGLLYLMMSTGSGSRISYDSNFLISKLLGIVKSLTSGSIIADLAFVTGASVFMLLLLFCARPRLATSFLPGLAGLLILYFILPAKMASGAYVDIRLPVAIIFLALAGLDAQFRPSRISFALLTVLGMAIVVKQSAITLLWRSTSVPADAIVHALVAIPPGAVIMQSECLPDSRDIPNVYRARQPAMQHLSSLSNLDDSIFVAAFYAIAGQQPIQVSRFYEPYYGLQMDFDPSCDPSDYRGRVARIRALMQAETTGGHTVPPLFFLLLRPPAATSLQPEARLLSRGPDHLLYRIANPGE
jgi:hypothetical protein